MFELNDTFFDNSNVCTCNENAVIPKDNGIWQPDYVSVTFKLVHNAYHSPTMNDVVNLALV